MSKVNLYLPVYQNLEREVIELTNSIHFCDEQLEVFSVKIGELLFRCCVEVESISKELFNIQFNIGDKHKIGKAKNIECGFHGDGEWKKKDKSGNLKLQILYFDYYCIDYLDSIWNLCVKTVSISCSNMFFDSAENKSFCPLSEEERTADYVPQKNQLGGWLKSYQAIKHSRAKNLKQGNLYHLIRALAALYLLNTIYDNNGYKDYLHLEDSKLTEHKNFGSKIFYNKSSGTAQTTVCSCSTKQWNGVCRQCVTSPTGSRVFAGA
ncbi:MAG: hypothetical protein LBN30_03320 [Oscillospiraceae bacterium]|jgi:hypothetical protein|nr:hypothetical protein [Oscillospiraceae bacterium]